LWPHYNNSYKYAPLRRVHRKLTRDDYLRFILSRIRKELDLSTRLNLEGAIKLKCAERLYNRQKLRYYYDTRLLKFDNNVYTLENMDMMNTSEGEVDFNVKDAGKPCKTWYKIFGDLNAGKRPLVTLHGGYVHDNPPSATCIHLQMIRMSKT